MSKLTALELKPSRYLAVLLILMHGGAIVILIALNLSLGLTLGLIGLCLLSLWSVFDQHVMRRTARAIIKIRPVDSAIWQLQDNRGQVWTARLCNDSVCTLYCLLLNFELIKQRNRRMVIIFSDSLDDTNFRRLRVVLKN